MQATKLYHLYYTSSGSALIMRCGAVSCMPEQSAPYTDTRRAFLGLSKAERCEACEAHIPELGGR